MRRATVILSHFFARYGVLLFFASYALIGLLCFPDYGCGPDEGIERQTSLVNFRYVIETFNIPVPQAITTWLAYLPGLKTYRDRFYGTALHMPLVLIESLTTFSMQPVTFYGMRHFYTFLNFFLAMVCFYRLLRKRFTQRWLALCGVLMMIISPRFFAESFYNNKDVLFLAWTIISSFFLMRWFEQKTARRAILAGIILAFTCNTRLNGIVFLPVVCFFSLGTMLADRSNIRKIAESLTLLIVAFLLTFYTITPNFWQAPWQTFWETFAFNSHHPNHGSDGNLFFGQLVDSTKVWFFIPVWVVLTTPTFYLLLSAVGALRVIVESLQHRIALFTDSRNLCDAFILLSGLLPVLIIIAMRVVIYNGWRHCYFAYGAIIYLAVVGVEWLLSHGLGSLMLRRVQRYCIFALLSVTLLFNAFWIVQNHPYEYAYFAPLFRSMSTRFSGDYWGISSRDLIRFIIEQDERPLISVDHSYTQAGSINRGLLPEEQRSRLDMMYDPNSADYVLYCRDEKIPAAEDAFAGYEKVFSIIVNDDEIGCVFRRIQ